MSGSGVSPARNFRGSDSTPPRDFESVDAFSCGPSSLPSPGQLHLFFASPAVLNRALAATNELKS